MRQYGYVLIFLSTFLVGSCMARNVDSDNEVLSRLEALEIKDQQRQLELQEEQELRHKVEGELAEVKQRLQEQQTSIAHQNSENSQQNDILKELKLQLKGTAGKDVLYKRQISTETVVFHATLDQPSGLQHIKIGSTIPFPDVKLNIAGGYDNSSSTFIAPMPGIYIFSVTIFSYWNDHAELHVGIMKNGQHVAGAYADGIGGIPEQGSVTIPLQLEMGDQVWVKHVNHDDGALYGGGLTSFMGCLIYGT